MSSIIVHEREQDEEELERYSKKQKLDSDHAAEDIGILPPSHVLLGVPAPKVDIGKPTNFLETDVGISEYIGRGEAKVEGIIKQRFTDFLVYEVDQDGNVIHLKSLGPPPSSAKEPEPEPEPVVQEEPTKTDEPEAQEDEEPWPERFTSALTPFLSPESLEKLKEIYLQGSEPPRVSDSGWAMKQAASENPTEGVPAVPVSPEPESSRGRGRGRGGRGARGGRGGGRGGPTREDARKVISEPMESKETRTSFHKVIRDLFKGKFDTQTDMSQTSDDGQRIVVKWAQRGSGRGGRGGAGGSRPSRGNFPPYIHFTMQKTNRDTQDALGHLSRLLHVTVKDLSVAGTKDKRGVTTQRVSLYRKGRTVEEVWKVVNGLNSRRTMEEVMSQRGERGMRIADLNYRKASLELGMLKGNAFLITLRNVKVESMELLDEAMNTIKQKGFINYYGMQRFGTASVPTHSIGLALLRSEWQRAADLILQKRHGEHPDVEAARDAWLTEKDLDKALSLFPRRLVAERSILESFRKQNGDTRNVMGALSTIPKNLRLMYIHAYQSYVWNAIVSERIRLFGSDKPIVGDIVYDKTPDDAMDVDEKVEEETSGSNGRSRKPYKAPQVKTLTEADLDKYTIFDVIMPLPGTSVAYPGGQLGERYREYLRMDGLDPDNFVRKQRDYTLAGSYRAMIHLPKEMSWKVLRYTDPDAPLAQADEDKLLGFDAPAIQEDGKSMALQISLQLGTAAYATMALREITKTDTSTHFQSNLTINADDQKDRIEAEAEVEVEAEVETEEVVDQS